MEQDDQYNVNVNNGNIGGLMSHPPGGGPGPSGLSSVDRQLQYSSSGPAAMSPQSQQRFRGMYH